MSGTEPNPGPQFAKIVTGSFNYGNLKFGYVAGKQFSAICLYSFSFSMVKDVKCWTGETLYSKVEHGTTLYKSIGKDEFLGVEDLPNVVNIFDLSVNIDFKFNSHDLLNNEKFYIDVMKDMIHKNVNLTDSILNTGFLLWLSDITISVIIKTLASQCL